MGPRNATDMHRAYTGVAHRCTQHNIRPQYFADEAVLLKYPAPKELNGTCGSYNHLSTTLRIIGLPHATCWLLGIICSVNALETLGVNRNVTDTNATSISLSDGAGADGRVNWNWGS